MTLVESARVFQMVAVFFFPWLNFTVNTRRLWWEHCEERPSVMKTNTKPKQQKGICNETKTSALVLHLESKWQSLCSEANCTISQTRSGSVTSWASAAAAESDVTVAVTDDGDGAAEPTNKALLRGWKSWTSVQDALPLLRHHLLWTRACAAFKYRGTAVGGKKTIMWKLRLDDPGCCSVSCVVVVVHGERVWPRDWGHLDLVFSRLRIAALCVSWWSCSTILLHPT